MIGLKPSGFPEVTAELEAVRARFNDRTPVHKVVAERIRKFVDDRFDTSTDPRGNKWDELKPETVKRRRKGSSKPLVDTTHLRGNIHADAFPDVVKWGTNVIYAGTHQWGHEEGGIAARGFLPVEKTGSNTYARIETGPAGVLWAKCEEDVDRYIKTGKLR